MSPCLDKARVWKLAVLLSQSYFPVLHISRNKLNNFGTICLVLIVFSGLQKNIHFNQYDSIQLHLIQSLNKEWIKQCTELYT